MERRTFLALFCVLLTGQILVPNGVSAAPIGAQTTSNIQVWQINIHNLLGDWQVFVDRLALAPVQPDIIIVQELCNCDHEDDGSRNDLEQFETYLNDDNFGPGSYEYAHAVPEGGPVGKGTQVVFWRASRFDLAHPPAGAVPNPLTWQVNIDPNCSDPQQKFVAVDLLDTAQANKHVVAASIQFPPNDPESRKMSRECLTQNLSTLQWNLNSLQRSRAITLVGGDFNKRPQRDVPQNATHGLETDPECWYRQLSAAHANTRANGTVCGPASHDSFYDAVWLDPAVGGATNPTLPTFCEQFTYRDNFGLTVPDPVPGAAVLSPVDGSNSCTDLNTDDKLDKSRFDYIWVSWGGQQPLPPVASTYVQGATADTWLDLDSLGAYSDHRGVQTLVSYPTSLLNPH